VLQWQIGALGEIRTPDPRNRNPMLYPAELRALFTYLIENTYFIEMSGRKNRTVPCCGCCKKFPLSFNGCHVLPAAPCDTDTTHRAAVLAFAHDVEKPGAWLPAKIGEPLEMWRQASQPTVQSAARSFRQFSRFDHRLRDHVGAAGSSERQHKVNDLRLPLWPGCEAQSLEQL
jgi:hypothetical protein